MGVFSVANWFLYKDSMTLLKLQILCYYAYAWSLVFLNKNENIKHKLFEDTFQGWATGPNCQTLYERYKNFRPYEIPKRDGKIKIYDKRIDRILESVWHTYGKFDEDQLTNIVYSEEPFQRARAGLKPWESGYRVIKDKDIFEYYSKLLEGE